MEVVKRVHYENSKRLVANEVARQWREHITRREGAFIKAELQKDEARFRVEVDWSCSFDRKIYDTILSFVLYAEYPYAKELCQKDESFMEEALKDGTKMFLEADVDIDISVSKADKAGGEIYYFTLTISAE